MVCFFSGMKELFFLGTKEMFRCMQVVSVHVWHAMQKRCSHDNKTCNAENACCAQCNANELSTESVAIFDSCVQTAWILHYQWNKQLRANLTYCLCVTACHSPDQCPSHTPVEQLQVTGCQDYPQMTVHQHLMTHLKQTKEEMKFSSTGSIDYVDSLWLGSSDLLCQFLFSVASAVGLSA